MVSFSRLSRLFVASACICCTVSVPRVADCQDAPVPAQQDSANRTREIFGALNFEAFLQFVGDEDDRIQMRVRAGNAGVAPRTDYGTAIGIGEDGEQKMLVILLEAYRSASGIAERWGFLGESCRAANSTQATDSNSAENRTACSNEMLANAQQARSRLKRELGPTFYKKVNLYVLERGWILRPPEDGDPCPPNYNPGPGETTHKACGGFYLDLMSRIVSVDAENQGITEGGESVRDKQLAVIFPVESEEQRNAVVALSLDTDRKIKENDIQSRDACDRYEREHPYMRIPTPPPPEIEALDRNRAVLANGYILQLRQELGDSLFETLDTYLAKQNKSIHSSSAAPQPSSHAAATVLPAVKP